MLNYLATVSNKLVLLFIISFGFSINSYANTISGTISLPNGIIAGPAGVNITLNTITGFISNGFESVTISQGQSSAAYSFNFADNEDRKIQFSCVSGCDSLDVTSEGGWDSAEGVVGTLLFSGETFSGNQNHVVNILLERADTFSGKIILPKNFQINQFDALFIRISSTDQFAFFDSFSIFEELEQGDTEVSFSIGVPSNISNTGWDITVSCSFCSQPIGDIDFFATRQNGGVMTTNINSAFVYPSNNDHRSLTLSYPFTDEGPNGFNPSPIFLLLDD